MSIFDRSPSWPAGDQRPVVTASELARKAKESEDPINYILEARGLGRGALGAPEHLGWGQMRGLKPFEPTPEELERLTRPDRNI